VKRRREEPVLEWNGRVEKATEARARRELLDIPPSRAKHRQAKTEDIDASRGAAIAPRRE
jgi:hypothetical protein